MNIEAHKKPAIWWIDCTGNWSNFQYNYAKKNPNCGLSQDNSLYGPEFYHLGLVKFYDYGTLIDVHWDVQEVSQGAINAILDHLLVLAIHDDRRFTVALKYYYGAWNTEICHSADNAFHRIIDINNFRKSEANKETLLFNQTINQGAFSHTCLSDAFENWQHMDGIMSDCNDPAFDFAMNESLMYGLDSYGNNFIYKHIGKHSLRTALLGKEWRYQALGNFYNKDQSDDKFEIKVTDGYAAVMNSGEPKLDHIVAHFQLDDNDPIWVNYERLILPWHKPNGEMLLMCLSKQCQNLSVPFMETVTT